MSNGETAAEKKMTAVDSFHVLAAEYERIWPGGPKPGTLEDYHKLVQANRQAALCLSGGGIRSAAFALGVLQALARKRLLTGFHYLSTVSGGGYIGGWLQRWIKERGGDAAEVMETLREGCDPRPEAIDGDQPRDTGTPPEPKQVRSLRENSNFITPRVGLSSNDTWTAISISVRNIAINWLLIAPLLLVLAMFPNLFLKCLDWVGRGAAANPWLAYLPFLLAIGCAMVAAWHTCEGLPSYRAVNVKVRGAGDGWFQRRIVRWLVSYALLGTLVLWADVQQALGAGDSKRIGLSSFAANASWPSWLTSGGLDFAFISLLAALAALLAAGMRLADDTEPKKDYRGAFIGDLGVWIVSFLVAAITIPIGCALFKWMATSAELDPDWRLRLFAALGPIWLMQSQLMIAFTFAALRRNRGGTVDADGDREWLARLSAVKIKQMILWGVLAFATLLLFKWLDLRQSFGNLSLTSLVAAISGAAAVFGGRGERTGHTTSSGPVALLRFLPLQTLISLATLVFGIALLTLFGAFEQAIANWVGSLLDPLILASGQLVNWWFDLSLAIKWLDREVLAHIVIGIVLVVLLLRLDKRIPINRFSLNGLYRNRLCRAFLGGARDKRDPDPFTGFDPADNVSLYELDPKTPTGTVLYPVINVALNVTASENLAWQERKAEPFILSPLYCGSGMLSPEPDLALEAPFAGRPAEAVPPGVYVDAHSYGGSEPEMIQKDKGISLATAISISGAAASPNMGYHSSAATAFLMTLFNVRLGQWMPNPARAKSLGEKVYLSNPSSSLRALLRELAGSTDDLGSDIYLSDGGHFENLAVYEMIRRRCRFILVSDAGCDPNCDLADLGALVRKAKIDLGAEIRFTGIERISSRAKPVGAQLAWAIGDIFYGDGHTGQILYLKPSFFEHNLPVDVRSYAAASADFPHETTGDQFFSESQFESYRKLGFTLASELGGEAPANIAAFFDELAPKESDEDGEEDAGLKTRMRRWLGI